MKRPFSFGGSLVGNTQRVQLVAMLRAARAWFDKTTLGDVLDHEFAAHPGCRVLFDNSVRVDHIGFLVPRWAKDLLSQAATEAGFPLGHRAFPSALIARELGRLCGKRRLATQIFKAYGHGDAAGAPAFEAFIPAADDTIVTPWIQGGVIDHIAVIVGSGQFNEIRTTLVDAGFPIAGFMYGRAVYLPGEDATMTYFDLGGGEHPYRLEVRTRGDLEDKIDDEL